jgi:hypothetical protein
MKVVMDSSYKSLIVMSEYIKLAIMVFAAIIALY